MAASMTDGVANSLALTYDPEHARIQQCVPNCTSATTTTLYLNDGATGTMTERVTSGSTTTWRTYIAADGKLVAERFVSGSIVNMRYFVLDHLGSVAVITDENGRVLTDGLGNETGRQSYDPWGKMRHLDGSADTACALPAQSASTRGYTSQEQMPSVCTVNYNARIYDPELGRFMSADPTVEAPYNPQDLNRYTYVGDNPLAFTDPTGMCFLGCFWKSGWFGAIVAIAIAIVAPMLIGPWESLVGVLSAAADFDFGAIAFLAGVSAVTGGITAGLSGGNILRGILFGAASGALFAGIGLPLGAQLGEMLGAPLAGSFIAQGFVGGLTSVIQGGHFAAGFLASGFGSLTGAVGGGDFDFGKMLVGAAIGGAAAMLGGGKFENGAISGAFAYAASTLAGESAEVKKAAGPSAPETGDDAQVLLARFPGVHACGNSLCGTVPVECGGSAAQCGMVADQLQKFVSAEDFHINFTAASGWEVFWQPIGHFFGYNTVLDIQFRGIQYDNGALVPGDFTDGVMHLNGTDWQTDLGVAPHEFSHFLGLWHNGAGGTLMYPNTFGGTATTLQPGERQNLISAYGGGG